MCLLAPSTYPQVADRAGHAADPKFALYGMVLPSDLSDTEYIPARLLAHLPSQSIRHLDSALAATPQMECILSIRIDPYLPEPELRRVLSFESARVRPSRSRYFQPRRHTPHSVPAPTRSS